MTVRSTQLGWKESARLRGDGRPTASSSVSLAGQAGGLGQEDDAHHSCH